MPCIKDLRGHHILVGGLRCTQSVDTDESLQQHTNHIGINRYSWSYGLSLQANLRRGRRLGPSITSTSRTTTLSARYRRSIA
ncbi:MAG: hypothetical protein MHM6MM_004120 [Cercozoa sp. M6MM]